MTGVVNTVGAGMDEVLHNSGQIVLISSVFAFLNGMGTIPYATSKAAVEQLGRGLRVELADHDVSVLYDPRRSSLGCRGLFILVSAALANDDRGRKRCPGTSH